MWFNSYAQLGPLLFAPGYGFWSTPSAFDVAHVVSAAVFASTVFPVYLLAHAVTQDRVAAVLAAVLAVAVPWLGMTASLMTEPIAYPAFAWSILAMSRAVERCTPRADAFAIVAIVVATLARTQLAVLGVAFLVAVAIVAFRGKNRRAGLRAALRGHVVLLVIAVLGAIVLIVSPASVLGAYAGPLEGNLLPPNLVHDTGELLAYVAIGTGVVALPLTLAYLGLTLWRPAGGFELAFAAVALSTGVVFALVSGSVNARYAAGINDRYLCFLAPILVVGAIALLMDRRPAVLPLCGGAALSAALLLAADLAQTGPSLVTPTQTFMPVLNGRAYELGDAVGIERLSASTALGVGLAVSVVLLALARLRLPGRALGLAVSIALVGVALAQTSYDLRRVQETQAGVSPAFLRSRGWLDRDVPGGEPIGIMLGEVFDAPSSAAVWWDTSFWSARADRVWTLPGAPIYDQGFARIAEIDERDGRIPALDERQLIALSAGEKRFGLQGAKPLAGFGGVQVVRVRPPVRAAWTLGDPAAVPGFVATGDRVRLRVFGDGSAATRTVSLDVVPSSQAPGEYRARLSGGGDARAVRPDKPTTLKTTVRLSPAGYRDLFVDAAAAGAASPAGPGAGISVQAVRITPAS
jgi:hypothetical protein